MTFIICMITSRLISYFLFSFVSQWSWNTDIRIMLFCNWCKQMECLAWSKREQECLVWSKREQYYLKLWLLLLLSWNALKNIKESLLLCWILCWAFWRGSLKASNIAWSQVCGMLACRGTCSGWGCIAMAIVWTRPLNHCSMKALSISSHWVAMITYF